MLEIARRTDARVDEGQRIPQEAQIVPTALDLRILYMPGASNRRAIHVVRPDGHVTYETWQPGRAVTDGGDFQPEAAPFTAGIRAAR